MMGDDVGTMWDGIRADGGCRLGLEMVYTAEIAEDDEYVSMYVAKIATIGWMYGVCLYGQYVNGV